jgi:hypothetical protein
MYYSAIDHILDATARGAVICRAGFRPECLWLSWGTANFKPLDDIPFVERRVFIFRRSIRSVMVITGARALRHERVRARVVRPGPASPDVM